MYDFKELLKHISLQFQYDNVVVLTSLVDNCEGMENVCRFCIEKPIIYDGAEYHSFRKAIEEISGTVVIISEKAHMPVTNRLLWECANVRGCVYIDTKDPYEAEERVTKKDRLLWDVQANLSKENNKAFMSGWKNSYNNEEFSAEELDEYIDNSRIKLSPYLHENADVLEVGVGSGMIAFALAPLCRSYDGCDISRIILQKTELFMKENNVNNVSFYNCAADEVDSLNKKYDVILMSSVTEYFCGYNYMREVVQKCVDCIDGRGYLFLGDIFDLHLKKSYKDSVLQYAKENPGCRFKKDFSHELFIPKEYWEDIGRTFSRIKKVVISNKIGSAQNEINNFRYDVLFEIDGEDRGGNSGGRQELHKYQMGYDGKEVIF